MEDTVDSIKQKDTSKRRDCTKKEQKLSSAFHKNSSHRANSKTFSNCVLSGGSSSSDENELRSLSLLRSLREVQKRIDKRVAQMEKDCRVEGKTSEKIVK